MEADVKSTHSAPGLRSYCSLSASRSRTRSTKKKGFGFWSWLHRGYCRSQAETIPRYRHLISMDDGAPRGTPTSSRRQTMAVDRRPYFATAYLHKRLSYIRSRHSVYHLQRHRQGRSRPSRNLLSRDFLRCFNRISTWELLLAHFGEPTWRHFDLTAYEEVLYDDYRQQALWLVLYPASS